MASDQPEFLIEGVGVSKVFKDFWGRPRVSAVNGVDIKVRRGSVFGLLGPNGAGKSTLIKMILGHLYPTAGRLQVFGQPPTDVAVKARLGYLPERAHLYRNLTASETLRFFGELLELPSDEITARANQLLAMVGLEGSRDRLVGEFSHGMMRRMGLAQALLNDPDLLLLDEPTAGLDPIGCREVKNLILTLAKRGKTVLLTTHLLADVEDTCDDILVMYGGKVLASGRTRDLLRLHDTLQIRLPAPPAETMRKVQELLSQVAPGQAEYSNPARSLEAYFMELVTQASSAGTTHGAQLGKGVASYLRQGVTESEEVLTALALSRTAEAPAATATPVVNETALAQLAGTKPANEPAKPAAPAINESLLADLTKKPRDG